MRQFEERKNFCKSFPAHEEDDERWRCDPKQMEIGDGRFVYHTLSSFQAIGSLCGNGCLWLIVNYIINCLIIRKCQAERKEEQKKEEGEAPNLQRVTGHIRGMILRGVMAAVIQDMLIEGIVIMDTGTVVMTEIVTTDLVGTDGDLDPGHEADERTGQDHRRENE